MVDLGNIAGEIGEGIARGVREVAGVFDIGEASGNDHGSSNWTAWGHEEIRSMLDTSVNQADIHDAAQAWLDQSRKDVEIFTTLTRDLNEILSEGWSGLSGDKAIGALRPLNDWSVIFSQAAERTAQLMNHSGSSVGQAKATVPPAMHHDMRRSLTSFVIGGVPGAFVDAMAQDHAQEEARREAVRIMTDVYSAPINDNRAAVPSYPRPVDPTLRPPEPSPAGGPAPAAGLPGAGSVSSTGGGGMSGNDVPYQPPAVVGLQSTGAGSVDGAQFGPSTGSPIGPPAGPSPGGGPNPGAPSPVGHAGGGQGLGAAAAAVPFLPSTAEGEQERTRRGFRGAGSPGGIRPGVGGGRPGGGGTGGDFGPRGSNPRPAATGEGRAGAGGATGGRGGGASGGVPVGGVDGRERTTEDTEHRRPSYLIEMSDIFSDGRRVAPPVIGENPPEYHD